MAPTYKVKHVGINHDTDEEARALVTELSWLFGLDVGKEGPLGTFVGTLFEVMKPGGKGTRGHIALQTEDVELAMSDLSEKGITFLESSIRRNAEGKIVFVYLKEEFSGFAIHLTV